MGLAPQFLAFVNIAIFKLSVDLIWLIEESDLFHVF